MSDAPARRSRWHRPSRRTILAVSLAALALCFASLLIILRPRKIPVVVRQTPGAPATVTVESAEVKAEPAARAKAVGRLPRGERLEIERDLGLWVEVRAGESSGFLPADALERDTDREARRRRAATILSFKPVEGVVVEDAELRLAPYPMAPRSGRIEKGSKVWIYAVDRDYYALKDADGGLAFVSSASVDVIPPDPALPAVTPARERALKGLVVTELAQPLPIPGAEEPLPDGAEEAGEPTAGAPAAVAPLEEPVEPAALLSKVDPAYPEIARRAGAEGTVVLEATIGADGRVLRVDVVKALPYGLSEAASAAVSRWRYKPARGRSGPIVSRKQVRIDFRLRG
jgi:TonB family protein